MKKLCGYIRSIGNYYKDAKGHHDIVDYTKAFLIILATIVVVLVLIRLICEK